MFLSYASQDAEAAKRIADALRAAGVEVWFDQNELVGGDAWDAKIRQQIRECALFLPLISANSQARAEGYFRREWKLAVERTHDMADHVAFLLPVVLDTTTDREAHVPAKFREVQWTRLPQGETSPAFAQRVKKLLGGSEMEPGRPRPGIETRDEIVAPPGSPRLGLWLALGGLAIVVLGLSIARPWQHAGTSPVATSEKPAAPLSEARKLEAQARALIDDDPLAVRENYHTAYELCERAVALSPDDGEIWATMARANCVLIANYNENSDRQVALARSQAERATRLAPHSIESGLAMVSFERLNRNSADIPAVRQRLLGLHEKAPTDRRILQELVRVEDNASNPDASASRRWAEQANALPGGDAQALVNLAWAYWGLNQYPEVEATLARALAIQPTSGAYHLKLMVLTVRGSLSGDQTAARAWLQQIPAAILREDRVAMIANQTLYYSRQPEAALKVLDGISREVLEEGRYFAPRSYLAGEALQMAGKMRAAEVEYRVALKVIEERLAQNARDSRLLVWKGRILARLGDREGAARQFETARELGIAPGLEAENLMLEGRNDDAIKAADALIVRTRSRWPATLGSLKANPVYDPLRSNPRFQQILTRGDAWMEEMYNPPVAASSAESAAVTQSPASRLLSPSEQPTVDQKSVAVLAFANLSDDKGNEYFSDGISEELLNVLAKVPGLKVTARTSAFHFKGKDTPIPDIARQLGVAYVVEGSVRKAGDKVRITAQLIKAADGFHVWSDTFTRDLKDIFAVQDEIAGLIAKNLELKLGQTAGVTGVAAFNPEAFRLYLQGREAWNRRNAAGFQQAELLFHRALELEPRFARAHAALADVWLLGAAEPVGGYAQRQSPLLMRIIAKAEQAVAMDEKSAEAHASLGHVLGYAWRFEESQRALRRAIELNPNYASAHQWLGRALLEQGRLDEALATLHRAAELDPLSHRILDNYSDALECAGRLEEAWAMLGRAAALHPSGVQIRCKQAQLLQRLGRRNEALAAARALAADTAAGEPDYRHSTAVAVLCAYGETTEAEASLQRISRDSEDYPIALLHLGRTREFIGLLDNAAINWIHNFWFHPGFSAVRAEPGVRAWTRKVGMAEALARAEAWTAAHPARDPEVKE